MPNYNSSYTGSQIDTAVGKIVNNSATSGQFVVADGNGGVSFVTVPAANGQSF